MLRTRLGAILRERRPVAADLWFFVLLGASLRTAQTGHTLAPAVIGIADLVLLAARTLFGPRPTYRAIWRVVVEAAVLVAALASTGMWLARRGRAHRRAPAAWRAGAPAAVRRPWTGPPADRARPGAAAGLVHGVGLLAVLLALNLAIGLVVELTPVAREDGPPPFTEQLGGAGRPVRDDPRADGVALRDLPWAATHLRDLQRTPGQYWPYVLQRPRRFRSETIDLDGWLRHSYEPPLEAGTDPVTIAFFGGSALFGEGQRDEHTIASEIARLAEAEGLPVRVRNYGQRGWTAWQEALLFEDVTAADPPDLAVFYDGANDLDVQAVTAILGRPTHFGEARLALRLGGRPLESQDAVGPPSLWRRVVDWYDGHSAVNKLWRAVRPGSGEGGEPLDVEVDGRSAREQVTAALDVYRRARAITTDLGASRGIGTAHYWQAVRSVDHYASASDEVEAPTIRLDHALDGHGEVYLDGIHTNEVGARLVAEAMWRTLEERVRQAAR